jgi:hypothetical protein
MPWGALSRRVCDPHKAVPANAMPRMRAAAARTGVRRAGAGNAPALYREKVGKRHLVAH